MRIAVVGVGLVGGEFISQLLKFPSPNPFRIVSLTSSKTTLYAPDGLPITPNDWKQSLSQSGLKPDLPFLVRELSSLVKPGQDVVLVDNTSSNVVAALYPQFLKHGVNVITPNKKAFSVELSLYESILSASLESGAKFFNEATVGAGLPIISTLKDLVATGDQVSVNVTSVKMLLHISKHPLGAQNRRRFLWNYELHLQRVLHRPRKWPKFLLSRQGCKRKGLHCRPHNRPMLNLT